MSKSAGIAGLRASREASRKAKLIMEEGRSRAQDEQIDERPANSCIFIRRGTSASGRARSLGRERASRHRQEALASFIFFAEARLWLRRSGH